MNQYEQDIEKMHAKAMSQIEEYINGVFEEKIKPWLEKYHLNFVAGMGDYFIAYTDKTPVWFVQRYRDTYRPNQPRIDKNLIDSHIRAILESSHEAINGYPIGSWMPSFDPR